MALGKLRLFILCEKRSGCKVHIAERLFSASGMSYERFKYVLRLNPVLACQTRETCLRGFCVTLEELHEFLHELWTDDRNSFQLAIH